ncbi:hypothetical protein ADUPG1_000704, partial [Aduncisulcus paluster]
TMSEEFWLEVAIGLQCLNPKDEYASLREVYQLQRESEGDDIYEVERIVNRRRYSRGNMTRYLVKWKGYPDTENTWVDETDIFDESIIKEYESKLASAKKPRKSPSIVGKRRSSSRLAELADKEEKEKEEKEEKEEEEEEKENESKDSKEDKETKEAETTSEPNEESKDEEESGEKAAATPTEHEEKEEEANVSEELAETPKAASTDSTEPNEPKEPNELKPSKISNAPEQSKSSKPSEDIYESVLTSNTDVGAVREVQPAKDEKAPNPPVSQASDAVSSKPQEETSGDQED